MSVNKQPVKSIMVQLHYTVASEEAVKKNEELWHRKPKEKIRNKLDFIKSKTFWVNEGHSQESEREDSQQNEKKYLQIIYW